MTRTQWMVVTVGVLCVIGASYPSSFAAEGHGQMMHGGHDQEDHSAHYLTHLLKHAKDIGLTQEQIRKLKAIQLDFRRMEARLEADTKVAKLELHSLLEDEQADINAIQAKVEQLKKAEGACLFEAIKSQRSARAMLTPEQREKEHLAHEQMKSGGQHGGGMGGMGHGGMMGGMMGSMGGSGHGQGSGDHGNGGAGGGQQHQH